MANTDNKFNPSYSTIKFISLLDKDSQIILEISNKNDQCQFERIEFTESITDIFPSGALIVRDLTDIVSYIAANKISKLRLDYMDASYSVFEITSTAYITNVASATEQNFISIYFTNSYYKYASSTSLNAELLKLDPNWSIPQVYGISEFVAYVNRYILTPATHDSVLTTPVIDATSNYLVYKPLNPKEYRTESPTDNAIQYLNYLASAALPSNISGIGNGPRFMFWTDFDNKINFKYFSDNIELDPNATNTILDSNYLRFGVFNGDAVIQKLSDGKRYRKISYLRTDPNNQYVSKNYHYTRKTPKIYDANHGNTNYASLLSFQFQDEGEKYNIELISSKGGTGATGGSDEIQCDTHWGYYNDLKPVNNNSPLTHLGQDYGTKKQFAGLNYMGATGYFAYVDNSEMWKNMFDMTEVHPHYPDEKLLPPTGINGRLTNLANILYIRNTTFKAELTGTAGSDRLEIIRQIEKQNFVMYVLCCMAKEQQSFFALLTDYQKDDKIIVEQQNQVPVTMVGPYRYNWVKLNFNSPYGSTGPSGSPTGSGGTYYIHQVERWEQDNVWKGTVGSQDETWAINLNERAMGISGNSQYLAPGWVGITTGNFKWRPIGVTAGTFNDTAGKIQHIVKMNVVPYTDLLTNSHNKVSPSDLGKYLYYFTAENVVDGTCQ
tara:strand:+ start:1931 stop:3925 length:1995 start_codon:yes stop_codon:yes gene_type:complete